MNVIVIGANGQLGSDIVRAAPKHIRVYPTTKDTMNVTNPTLLEKNISKLIPDVIINTSAYTNVDLAETEAESAFMVNSVGVKNLVDICIRKNIVLVHISTDYVFDGAKLRSQTPYYEDDTPNPLNIYGISKYAGELIIRNYMDKFYIVRTSALYGMKGSKGKGGNFVYSILKRAKYQRYVNVVNDMYTSPTYTLDLANGIWQLLINGLDYGIYHMANSGHCTWYEFAEYIIRLSNLQATINPISYKDISLKAKRPLWSVLGTKKDIKLRHWKCALEEFMDNLLK